MNGVCGLIFWATLGNFFWQQKNQLNRTRNMRFIIKRFRGKKAKSWILEYRIHGERVRSRFKTKELAQAEQERIEGQVKDGGTAWLALTANERVELMSILREIQDTGKTLRAVWDEYKRRSFGKTLVDKKLGEAFELFKAERERAKLSKRTLQKHKSAVGRFVEPRAAMFVSQITRQDVADHLAPYHDETFNTYRNSLAVFFNWCVKPMKFAEENPVADIELIDRRRMEDKPPAVLNHAQCVALFRATLEHDPRLLRYVAVCLLAGLRPEREAVELHPADITDRIYVRGRTAKDRQQRYVEIIPALKEWLALSLPAPAQGPQAFDYPIANLRRRFVAIRERAGLIKVEPRTRPKKKGKGIVKIGQKIIETAWHQDCMRHTFASAFYAAHGADRTIAALGHGDYDMLFQHYRRLMTKEEAEKILSITPAVVTAPPSVPGVPSLILKLPPAAPKAADIAAGSQKRSSAGSR
jgi:site-specific recombinase XerD